MTRDILLFGGICAISVDMIDGNGDVVRGLNEAYADATNINVRFDALPTKEPGEVLLVFLMDGDRRNDNRDQKYVSSIQAYLITGDDGENNLPYSFVGDLDRYKKLLTVDYFEKMWRKNSDAGGGDPFILKNIFYTANGIYVIVKFDV